MSAKRDPEEDDEAFLAQDDNDDDDEEEEDDFVPGMEHDDEPDDDDLDDDETDIVPLLDGTLSWMDDTLHFIGEGFHLQSTKTPAWNILDKTMTPTADSLTLDLVGNCDIGDVPATVKPKHRTIQVKFTRKSSGKSEGGDEASYSYAVYGSEKEGDGDRIEFQGSVTAGADGAAVNLTCHVRTIPAAQPAVAAVAAVATVNHDDDYDDEEADDGVDYNELIALHNEANVSVEELRKRYRSGNVDEGIHKRGKMSVADDDDDDDIAF